MKSSTTWFRHIQQGGLERFRKVVFTNSPSGVNIKCKLLRFFNLSAFVRLCAKLTHLQLLPKWIEEMICNDKICTSWKLFKHKCLRLLFIHINAIDPKRWIQPKCTPKLVRTSSQLFLVSRSSPLEPSHVYMSPVDYLETVRKRNFEKNCAADI